MSLNHLYDRRYDAGIQTFDTADVSGDSYAVRLGAHPLNRILSDIFQWPV